VILTKTKEAALRTVFVCVCVHAHVSRLNRLDHKVKYSTSANCIVLYETGLQMGLQNIMFLHKLR
jgi:hypothetical protein